ncbi:transcriptional regulator family: Fungal Specific TF [Penicillium roqueforti]|nr:transcriptional regulator family: Fungal Specific TF [Penicillium roqueforti]KAI3120929.1 transcriptional regulator family: Fungal Specific TF [Penicillium roqueforti]
MTAGEPSHTDKDGAVPPRETSTKQPTADIAPAGLRPLSIANTMSTIGAKRTNPGQASLSKTIAASQTKVAIPRQRVAAAPRYNRRVPRACSSCRQRKTKCSGDTPICRQCRELRATCSYPDGWREKTKKQVEALSEKAQEYENLLKELRGMVEFSAAERIRSLLDKYGPEVDGSSQSQSRSQSATPQDDIPENDEPSSPSSIGSLEAIDRVEEDINRSPHARATGYMGKNSEITWMQRLQREADQRAQGLPGSLEFGQDPKIDNAVALHAVNYHLDDLDISVPEPVQLYAMPPREVADHMFEAYLTTVHPFFPIINKPLFSAQYRTFFDSAARPGDKWLAILNMIFAIGAKHGHLIVAPWRGTEKDHLIYLTRARILSMNGDVLFSHPDLQQVQVEGLIAFYLLASDQINRAWRISALAVRSAITLGINMKSSSPTTPDLSKEARYRVWWCLYTFEHLLGIMTGRSTCIRHGVCTSPFPIPFEEEQLQMPEAVEVLTDAALRDERINNVMASSRIRQMPLHPVNGKDASHHTRAKNTEWVKNLPINYGLCHLYYCDLTVVVQEIVNKVYSVDCVMVPWAQIEQRISELKSRTDIWKSSLPTGLDFTRKDDNGPDILRCKISLALHYYSARITLGRPCLCRRDARRRGAHPSFSHEMAVITLHSARHMLDLVPDEPDAIQLYRIAPWWCILHYLMQATTVLLLELSFGTVHMPEEENNFVALSKKAIRWLFAMSEQSIASRRAWQLCDLSLRKLAQGMKYDVSDMPSYPYTPEPKSTISPEPLAGQSVSQADGDYWGPQLEHLPVSVPEGPPREDHDTSTVELMTSLTAEAQDSYFPYDPISGEFMRSFFPNSNSNSNENDNWEL